MHSHTKWTFDWNSLQLGVKTSDPKWTAVTEDSGNVSTRMKHDRWSELQSLERVPLNCQICKWTLVWVSSPSRLEQTCSDWRIHDANKCWEMIQVKLSLYIRSCVADRQACTYYTYYTHYSFNDSYRTTQRMLDPWGTFMLERYSDSSSLHRS